MPGLSSSFIRTSADLGTLAHIFDGIRYPGAEIADAALDRPEGTAYLFCRENHPTGPSSWNLLSLAWDDQAQRFRDPRGVYPQLRLLRDGVLPEGAGAAAPWRRELPADADFYTAALDAAVVLARYDLAEQPRADASQAASVTSRASEDTACMSGIADVLDRLPDGPAPRPEIQRWALTRMLASRRPDRGLNLLLETGFIDEVWPELAAMARVDHAKEFHPEGNVWVHTLETFQYRKSADLRLSLGLLLHDVGKPLAAASGTRRFDQHAELGERAAGKFLERLDFDPPLIADVRYLVRNHMLPAVLPRLPLTRTQATLESPLFPTLLELYRCDEFSSFKGPGGYYESAAAYQSYLRHLKNPYRSADGKKLKR